MSIKIMRCKLLKTNISVKRLSNSKERLVRWVFKYLHCNYFLCQVDLRISNLFTHTDIYLIPPQLHTADTTVCKTAVHVFVIYKTK